MKKVLTVEEMAQIDGGSAFWDGFCIGASAAKLISPILALTGVGIVLLNATTIGCLIYGASKL